MNDRRGVIGQETNIIFIYLSSESTETCAMIMSSLEDLSNDYATVDFVFLLLLSVFSPL